MKCKMKFLKSLQKYYVTEQEESIDNNSRVYNQENKWTQRHCENFCRTKLIYYNWNQNIFSSPHIFILTI